MNIQTKAILAHFACDKTTLICDLKLELYTSVAIDFMKYFMTGESTEGFERAMKTSRYRIKKELVERYIKDNS